MEGGPGPPSLHEKHQTAALAYLPIAARTASIFAFTASRLKLAPFCIGGNSMAIMASLATSSWTKTKRQNSYLYQSQYWKDPAFPAYHVVRSNGSRRKFVIVGTSGCSVTPSQPSGCRVKLYL